MKFTETKLHGAYIIELEKKEDERGFFARSWDKKIFSEKITNKIKSIKEPISFLDIEIYHSNLKLKIRLGKDWNEKYKVRGSISHETKYAIGIVISEKIK